MEGMVYVVDDDPSVCRSLERVLRSVGLDVCTFCRASDFLETRRLPVPSCLVLDYHMPTLDGLRLQESLTGGDLEMPIIFLTGCTSIPVCVRAMQAGAVTFLTKPAQPEPFLAAVREALEVDRARLGQLHVHQGVREAYDTLTARELEVFHMVVRGMLNKQIGYAMGVTEKTVKVHRARVKEKLGAPSVADLVRVDQHLRELGVLPPLSDEPTAPGNKRSSTR